MSKFQTAQPVLSIDSVVWYGLRNFVLFYEGQGFFNKPRVPEGQKNPGLQNRKTNSL
jgi:hypothetical protein